MRSDRQQGHGGALRCLRRARPGREQSRAVLTERGCAAAAASSRRAPTLGGRWSPPAEECVPGAGRAALPMLPAWGTGRARGGRRLRRSSWRRRPAGFAADPAPRYLRIATPRCRQRRASLCDRRGRGRTFDVQLVATCRRISAGGRRLDRLARVLAELSLACAVSRRCRCATALLSFRRCPRRWTHCAAEIGCSIPLAPRARACPALRGLGNLSGLQPNAPPSRRGSRGRVPRGRCRRGAALFPPLFSPEDLAFEEMRQVLRQGLLAGLALFGPPSSEARPRALRAPAARSSPPASPRGSGLNSPLVPRHWSRRASPARGPTPACAAGLAARSAFFRRRVTPYPPRRPSVHLLWIAR